MRLWPATVHLRRAQLTLMLAVLIPTVLMTATGIVQIIMGDKMPTLVAAILILAFCTTGITGYVLGSIYVGRGASLARIQNDFLSSVSHELRTPLTSINLLLESLRDGRLPKDDEQKVIALLGRETSRLEELVGRLLELTKIETGAHVFERRPVDVTELVAESIAAFDASSLTRPTPIKLDVQPELVINGDRATLIRAIVNLLTNAWKYTGDDKQITLTAAGVGRSVEIAVSDNGIGMSRAEQRRAFDRFARGKAAIDRKTPGVGLGMAFVRAIIRGHKAKISIDSIVGKGTTVRMRFGAGAASRTTAVTPAAAMHGGT